MKKIGILTFHKGPNYGGFLQAWHMREAARSLGHDAHIINYQNSIHYRSEQTSFPTRLTPRGIRAWINRRKKSSPFEKVVGDLCAKPFTTNPDEISWQDYDLVIVGSDVVWDHATARYGHDPCYFANHPSQQDGRFIAYAASCGPANNSTIPDFVRNGIPGFLAIGVRDSNTRTLVESCGGPHPSLVVDPTWLQPDPETEWRDKPDYPYLLVYGGGLVNPRFDEAVGSWAKAEGLPVISAASPTRFADRRYQSLEPFQWAELFRGASAVVTATLHGLLYSIKYGKPFIMVALPAAAGKSSTVIEKLGLESRVVIPGGILEREQVGQLLAPDSGKVEIPADWIRESESFLKNAIDKHA